MSGLIHIYCGDGKGKTTASVGLAVRAAGSGKKVLFTQFFKNGSSSEIAVLKSIPGITVHVNEKYFGLYIRMTDEEKEEARTAYTKLLQEVLAMAMDYDLLILDEAVSSCNHGTIPEDKVVDFLRRKPDNLEVVLTGRKPSERLVELADYVTEMKKIKHPMDDGIIARKGIEF